MIERPGEYLTGLDALAHRTADHILRDSDGDCPQVLVGPVVWEHVNTGRRWYFLVATAGTDGFRTDQLAADDQVLAERLRAALLLALVQRRPIVVHDIGDELDMARLAASIWPGPQTAGIAAAIEAERGTRH